MIGNSQNYRRRDLLKYIGTTSAGVVASTNVVSAEIKNQPTVLELGEPFAIGNNESISVKSGTVRHSFFHLPHFDAPDVRENPGYSYIFGEISSSLESSPSETKPSDYKIVIDNQIFDVSYLIDAIPFHQISMGNEDIAGPFLPESENMRMAQRTGGGVGGMVKETDDASRVGIGYSANGTDLDVIWEFGESKVHQLNSRPDLKIKSVTSLGSTKENQQASYAISVENSSPTGGVFRGLIGAKSSNHHSGIRKYIGGDSVEEIEMNVGIGNVQSTEQVVEQSSEIEQSNQADVIVVSSTGNVVSVSSDQGGEK